MRYRIWVNLSHLELAQPIIKLEEPQIKIPRPRPMDLMTGTAAKLPAEKRSASIISATLDCLLNNESHDVKLPVAQMTPPIIAKGWNLGDWSIMSPTMDTTHTAAQNIHWKNRPGKHNKGKLGLNFKQSKI